MEKKLTRRDLFLNYWLYMAFCQTCYQFERLQALGLTFAMIPMIKKLYDKTEDRIAALKRHMLFFNTEPLHFGVSIIGVVAAMEEKRANGANVTDDDINAVKVGMMGPLAGIGDTWIGGLMSPILLSIGANMAIQGNYLGPILWTVLFPLQMYLIGWNMYQFGYRQGKEALASLFGRPEFKTFIEAVTILGLMVVGAIGAQRVGIALDIAFNAGGSEINIQKILDQFVPGLVPLAAILGTWEMLRRKVNPTYAVIVLFLVGFVLGAIGLLGAPA
jgi:PTS system mannose-specific IID component